jgi:hypothetical protein
MKSLVLCKDDVFCLTVSGLSLAQAQSTTALEKASDNAALIGRCQAHSKPNADKVKAEKDKAATKRAPIRKQQRKK